MEKPAFHEAFADALARRKVTLAWLHDRLEAIGHPVSVTALSYWRSGRSQPERGTSLDALAEIERLLNLPPDTLGSLIGPSRRPGPQPAELTPEEVFEATPGIKTALGALGFEGLYDELTEHMRHFIVDIGSDGQASGIQVRTMMRARRDGARRTPLVFAADESGARPAFVPVSGCTLGAEHVDHDTGVFATELLLDRALAKGELAMFELDVEFPEPLSDTWFEHFAARRLPDALVWVRFHPDKLPSSVVRYTETGGRRVSESLTVDGATQFHATARGFGPGVLGVSWTW